MEYIEVAIRDEFIRLGQAMKLAGKVKVNGQVEERRGRKLHKGDVFTYQGQDYKIV